MTHNQIDYWNLKETERHNVVSEKETNRHNVVTEVETNRHNVATENIDLSKLGETKRHNIATEGIAQGNLNLGYHQLAETTRHNQASEALSNRDLSIKADTLMETGRHNLISESISQQHEDAYVQQAQAEAALKDIQKTWSGLLSSTNVQLNDAQKDKINADIDKVRAEISYMPHQNVQGYWNSVNGTLNGIAHMVNALIPG